MTTKKTPAKKTSAEWPPAAVGSNALESLRDGNPPNELIAFVRNAVGAGNHPWAMSYLRRGVDYLRYVMTSFPEVADRVAAQHDLLVRMLVDIAVVTGDEAALEFSLSANPKPAQLAGRAELLNAAKKFELSVHWFVRARQMPMTAEERYQHLRRFGTPEIATRKRAKMEDVAVAREFAEFAEEALRNFDPNVDYAAARKLELQQLLRYAKKALPAPEASEAPEKPKASSSAKRARSTK